MPDRYSKAIVAGDACLDIHLKMEDLLADHDVTPYKLMLGGTCGSSAGILAKLGVDTAFLGTIGKDYLGSSILKKLKDFMIDTDMVIVNEELNTIAVLAFIDPSGERHLWGFPREDQAFSELDLERVDLEKLKSASWLHSSGMSLMAKGSLRKNMPELFKIAYEAGVPTSLDLNTRVSDLKSLDEESVKAIQETLPYVKYLLGSAKDEFYSFYPCEDYMDSVRHFANEKRTVIARMGKDGFTAIHDGTERHFSSYEVNVVNSTAAGDSFNAGFIRGMLEEGDVWKALEFANAVAAYKISREDPDDLPEKEKVLAFMKEHKL